MHLALSEVLNVIGKWQNAATRVRGTLILDTHDCVTQFRGCLTMQGESITIVNEDGCETCVVLGSDMTFAYADGMLRIAGKGWCCTLFEEKLRT